MDKIREHYQELLIYTDSNAAKIFGEILNLPYTEIKVCFDDLDYLTDKY
nr:MULTISPECIES: DUF6734 family protein [unclassified Pedobacter]